MVEHGSWARIWWRPTELSRGGDQVSLARPALQYTDSVIGEDGAFTWQLAKGTWRLGEYYQCSVYLPSKAILFNAAVPLFDRVLLAVRDPVWIRGTLSTSAGQPWRDTRLQLHRKRFGEDDWKVFGSCVTSSSGEFSHRVSPTAAFDEIALVVVDSRGRHLSLFRLLASDVTEPVRLVADTRPYEVHLRDERGNPVKGGSLTTTIGMSDCGDFQQEWPADDSGVVRMELDNRPNVVLAWAKGYSFERLELDANSSATQRITLLRRGEGEWLSGRIVAPDGRVIGGRVLVWPSLPPPLLTDYSIESFEVEDRPFRLPVSRSKALYVQVEHPQFLQSRVVRVPPEASEVTIEYGQFGSARLILKGALPGLAVTSGDLQIFVCNRTTGDARTELVVHSPAWIERLAAGSYNAFVQAGDGWHFGSATFEVASGGVVDVEVSLGAAQHASGVVIDGDGHPVEGARIAIIDESGWGGGRAPWGTCRSGSTGQFELLMGLRATARVEIVAPGFRSRQVEIPADPSLRVLMEPQ